MIVAAPAHAETNPSLYPGRVSITFGATTAPTRTAVAPLFDREARPLGRIVTDWSAQAEMSAPLAQRAPRSQRRRSRPYRQAQRLTAAVAMGVLGSLAGGLTGAAIGSTAGENGVLAGFGIGLPVGAVAGATLGVILTK